MSKSIPSTGGACGTYVQALETLMDDLPAGLQVREVTLIVTQNIAGRWVGDTKVEEYILLPGDILVFTLGAVNEPRIVQYNQQGELTLISPSGEQALIGEKCIYKWLARGDYKHTGQTIFDLVKEWKEKVEFESEDRIVSGVRQ